MDMIEKLSLAGIVPVIKVEDAGDAVPLCKALADGGLQLQTNAGTVAVRLPSLAGAKLAARLRHKG